MLAPASMPPSGQVPGIAIVADGANAYWTNFTNGTVISAGSTVYYRFNRDWFGIGSVYVNQTSLKQAGMAADPSVLGLSGYARLAYRF